MKRILIIVGVLIVLAIAGAVVYFMTAGSSIACSPETAVRLGSSDQSATSSATMATEATITYEDGKFTPECVVVTSGTNLTWVNRADENIQIGADPHPIHTGDKDVSDGEFVLEIAPGETKTVTMSKIGNAGYHNHLNSSAQGLIIVE